MGSNTKLNVISNQYRSLLVIENIKVEFYNQTVTLCNLFKLLFQDIEV